MIIGLAGAAGAGKDTAAAHLCDRHGFTKASFADPIYQMISTMTGIPVVRLADRSVKESPVGWLGASPRRLLQTLGTEWARGTVGEDVWIKHLFRRVDGLERVVVTDVRFANEAQAIRERGGFIVEVVRPSPLDLVANEARQHSSEAGIPDDLVDVTIVNDTDIAGLLGRVDKSLEWLLTDTMV